MEGGVSPKKLYRSTKNKMIAGVCAGIAEYMDLDVTVVRVLFAVVTIAGGAGILAYIVMMLLMPEKPFPE